MQIKLIGAGILLMIVGIIMHVVPAGIIPKMGWHPVRLPGYLIAIVGALLAIAGFLLVWGQVPYTIISAGLD